MDARAAGDTSGRGLDVGLRRKCGLGYDIGDEEDAGATKERRQCA
jgi:hypothetical protein